MPATISCSGRPRASSTPDMPVAAERAGARQHEIAEAAQTRRRLSPPPRGRCKPRDLGETAGDERSQRVVAQTRTLDYTRGNRDDVFQRPAEFHADDIVRAVKAEVRRAELVLHARQRGAVMGRNQHRSRPLLRNFHCECRTRQHAYRMAVARLLGDHL
jgi:hypothetical protein